MHETIKPGKKVQPPKLWLLLLAGVLCSAAFSSWIAFALSADLAQLESDLGSFAFSWFALLPTALGLFLGMFSGVGFTVSLLRRSRSADLTILLMSASLISLVLLPYGWVFYFSPLGELHH